MDWQLFSPVQIASAPRGQYVTRDDSGELPAYAWPGGYQMLYITRSGLTVCPKCANDGEAVSEDPPTMGDVYWEGPNLDCDDCGATIPSAYGDPDAE